MDKSTSAGSPAGGTTAPASKPIIYVDIVREYFPTGTNGEILMEGKRISYSIELPWKNNQKKISCVPEGEYPLSIYDSPKHGPSLLINNVPGRSMCEFHAANWALGKDGKHPQLEGCVAPVTTLEPGRPGVGWDSGRAVEKLEAILFPLIRAGNRVILRINKKQKNHA